MKNVAQTRLRIVFGICLMLLLVTKGGYAMQPPPPPLNVAQLRMFISEANLVVVGKIGEVKETDNTIEVALKVEKVLKGRLAGKTIAIKEIYKPSKSQLQGKGSKEGEKAIVMSIAGPSYYHGSYKKGKRIVVLLEKIEGTDTYRPLGSGTYNKHLCEFLIEANGIKTLYFKFADDVEKHAVYEKQFINFIKKIIKSN